MPPMIPQVPGVVKLTVPCGGYTENAAVMGITRVDLKRILMWPPQTLQAYSKFVTVKPAFEDPELLPLLERHNRAGGRAGGIWYGHDRRRGRSQASDRADARDGHALGHEPGDRPAVAQRQRRRELPRNRPCGGRVRAIQQADRPGD